ncbi:hypothetical protein J5N97_005151 [Dioscorea zingiberensis]|uniref:GDSL esterase/lipase 7 n=1 Tax=Dioscorea zingiberensis TaxID=325984 RepID=A0A9D5D7J1_9LILI|nr:hypothetical protein J5N97_005151 [Dioscorea zingiberensis]
MENNKKKLELMKASFPFSYLSQLLLFMSFFISLSDCTKTPAIFIFGDSLIDNGNNNYLPSIAKANYFPYGIDYGMPTGRFSNGLTVMDYAARWLGFPYPPPYLSMESKTTKIMKGVNYASAAAGILASTGRHYGGRVTFNGQIELFEKTVKLELPMLISDTSVLSEYLANSIFLINIGSNDYINNYLLPNMYTSSQTYSPKAFADLLINTFTDQLTRLYRLGARKMVLVGIGPLGCIPSQLSMNNSSNGACIQRVNDIVSEFNQLLLPLSTSLISSLPGSYFVYHNTYDTFSDMVHNPSNYVTNQACCGSGKYGGTMSCLPMQQPCGSREQFIFWDSFHPTQAANAILAERCYSPSATECHPISAYQLALM